MDTRSWTVGILISAESGAVGSAVKGVVTHSSGNHGQALAWAAREAGLPCHVVIPRGAPAVKAKAIGEDRKGRLTGCNFVAKCI